MGGKQTEDYPMGCLSLLDRDYPELLRHIQNPPALLYYIGDLGLLSGYCVAIVGTRHPTNYGRWVATAISRDLAERGVVVVSGMAAGLDTCAHEGALAAGGKTIAVLGCGLDICYPKSNRRLMARIAAEGLLLSEYCAGFHPSKITFPARNRIISGISEATVIVEAGLQSGSIITAERAAEQGRQVFAVPGNINSIYSLGTNKLIRDGATAISSIDDLRTDMGLAGKSRKKEKTENLSDREREILRLLAAGGELTMEQLAEKTGMEAGKICGIITVMEMKGLLCTSFGKVFIAN